MATGRRFRITGTVTCSYLAVALLSVTNWASAQNSTGLAQALGISFPEGASTVLLERDGHRYLIDVATKSVRETGTAEQSTAPSPHVAASPAAALFVTDCAKCHGVDGKGNAAIGSPNFTNKSVQRGLSDSAIGNAIHNGKGNIMPAWKDKLNEPEIQALVAYVRSFGGEAPSNQTSTSAVAEALKIYEPGDDVLLSLPTGRPIQRHGTYVNFAHRFAYDPAFTGTGRGEVLFGLDGFAIPSFGFTYGVTENLAVSIYRSPSIVGRPIQLMAAYSLLEERHGAPLNVKVRVSLEGQNNFRKNFTENIEGIFSRSLTHRAQIYVVPTISFNDRPLVQGGFRSRDILDLPGTNAFSLGFGLAVDVRPTVALLGEIIPTFAGARDLTIHRPAYAFGIQKKIYRHAFTFGFSTSPGTTVSQRAGTRASFLGDPGADKPTGLFVGFDLTRQIR